MNKILIIINILFILISCKENNQLQNRPSNIEISKERIKKIKNTDKKRIISFFKDIQLETKEECFIGNIHKAILIENDTRLLIFDKANKNVFLFDSGGKFLYSIGKNGQGPFEYLDPTTITYGDSIVAISSHADKKVLLYSLDGEPLREIKITDKHNVHYVDNMSIIDGDLYLYNNIFISNTPIQDQYRIIKYRNCIEFQHGYSNEEETFFLGTGNIIKYGNKILFNGIFNGVIYEIDPETNTTSKFADIGEFYNTKFMQKLKEKGDQEPLNWFIKEWNENNNTNITTGIGMINDFIFVKTARNRNALVNSNGEVIRKDFELNPSDFTPEHYDIESIGLADGFQFTSDYIITAALKKEDIKNGIIRNPSILLFRINY